MPTEFFLVMDGDENALEWKYRARANTRNELANLLCYGPVLNFVPKQGVTVVSSTNVWKSPCGTAGAAHPGVIYELR